MRVILTLLRVPLDLFEMLVSYIPGPLGHRLRYYYWKGKLGHLGKNATIDTGVYFQNPEYISLDDNCWIDRNVVVLAGPPHYGRITYEKPNPKFPLAVGCVHIGKNTHVAPNCVLSGIGGLYIGDNCGVAANSALYSFSHHYRNLSDKDDKTQYAFTPRARLNQQAMILSPIVISNYCAMGLHTVALPGTCLGAGTWIASGLVISGEYPQQSLVTGEPVTGTRSLAEFAIRE